MLGILKSGGMVRIAHTPPVWSFLAQRELAPLPAPMLLYMPAYAAPPATATPDTGVGMIRVCTVVVGTQRRLRSLPPPLQHARGFSLPGCRARRSRLGGLAPSPWCAEGSPPWH